MWYDYKCTNTSCHWKGELSKPIFAPELTVCPHCKNETLVRDYNSAPPSIHLFGPGFHDHDYKNKKWRRDH